jgi:spermidine/putrescine transport system ATP-binding protein
MGMEHDQVAQACARRLADSPVGAVFSQNNQASSRKLSDFQSQCITLRNVRKTYGQHVAVDNISLEIKESEFLVLLGPSGCGKTTILRMIAGFIHPTAGQIFMGSSDVTNIPTRRRQIGMVFQNYALFPNMTVAENIAFGLKSRGVEREVAKKRVAELLEMTHLSDKGDNYTDELSGGQQQRVALARAIAYSPRVLLMDEPLSALDLKLRESMQIELKRLQKSLNITTVLVTHDQHEAMSLADRIVVMSKGEFHQVGTPEELYAKPATNFVADFIGKNNILQGTVVLKEAGVLHVNLGDKLIVSVSSSDKNMSIGAHASVAIRPENIVLSKLERGETLPHRNAGRVVSRQFFGSTVQYSVQISPSCTLLVERPAFERSFSVDETVVINFETVTLLCDDR